MDKAGKKYWNDTWSAIDIPEPVDPSVGGANNLMRRRFHAYFLEIFGAGNPKSETILEVGCAKSSWLPYFSKEFGLSISGIDYSPVGCEMASAVLNKSNVFGEIVCADIFAPPSEMRNKFDYVVSFGVVEHFEDTAACVAAVSAFLKPGGKIITIIPNMVGAIGFIQKFVNRPVFDIHQMIDADALRRGHERAGLKVDTCEYFMATHFGVCNLNGVEARTVQWFIKKIVLALLIRISKFIWRIEGVFGALPPSKAASPYVVCTATK
jgi:2-polyprenyl-3-methyl-5-hydroxy-6-metoxy-1,4-benzoquinol methylase